MADQSPFADVVVTSEGFSLPVLKWRELLFVGALRAEGDHFVRDPDRPLPPFKTQGLFPVGIKLVAERRGARVFVMRAAD